MPTKQFIFNYTGNKFVESKNLKINFKKYNKIVECFGGSFGFSRYLYINDKVNKETTFDIYDIDGDMIDFFNYLKSLNLEEYNKFIKDYNDFCGVVFNECSLVRPETEIKKRENRKMVNRLEMIKYLNERCEDIPTFIKYLVKHNATTTHFSCVAIKDNLDEKYFEMIKKCSFYNIKFEDIEYSKYDKKNTLFYLDPPYLLECNTFYKKMDKYDVDTYYETIMMLFKNYKTYLTTSENWLVNKVFSKWKVDSYDKLYQINKTKRTHVSYYNKKV